MTASSSLAFPKITNKSLFHLTNQLNLAMARKHLFCHINFCKKNEIFLNMFKKSGIISTYFICHKLNKPLLTIFITYYSNKLPLKFKIISKPSKSYFMSHASLVLLNKELGVSLLFILTTEGLLTHREALNKNTGGLVIGLF